MLLLFFFCEEYNSTFQKEANSVHLQELAETKLQWNQNEIQKFSLVFCQPAGGDWSIKFDRFFMNFNPSELSKTKMDIIKKAILSIIEGMMRSADAEKANILINEYNLKKEKEER